MMKEIQFKDAKATLSRVIDDAVAGQPSVVTRHGKKEVVIIGFDEYQRLSRAPSFGWLIANSPLEEPDLPARRPARALRKGSF